LLDFSDTFVDDQRTFEQWKCYCNRSW